MPPVTSDELVAKRLATTPPYVTEKKTKKTSPNRNKH